jgi:hypothetical protein
MFGAGRATGLPSFTAEESQFDSQQENETLLHRFVSGYGNRPASCVMDTWIEDSEGKVITV